MFVRQRSCVRSEKFLHMRGKFFAASFLGTAAVCGATPLPPLPATLWTLDTQEAEQGYCWISSSRVASTSPSNGWLVAVRGTWIVGSLREEQQEAEEPKDEESGSGRCGKRGKHPLVFGKGRTDRTARTAPPAEQEDASR